MNNTLTEIKKCQVCAPFLALGVNPVLAASPQSKIAIVGQAPGLKVHQSGVPWDDKSGERLRMWLDVDSESFYDSENFALVPMGFCYPGKGKSGDLPPRKECAPLWHQRLFVSMPHLQLVILIGTYAQDYYLGNETRSTLTETVRNYEQYLPRYFPIPHPSPRNNIWLRKNQWFEDENLAALRSAVFQILNDI